MKQNTNVRPVQYEIPDKLQKVLKIESIKKDITIAEVVDTVFKEFLDKDIMAIKVDKSKKLTKLTLKLPKDTHKAFKIKTEKTKYAPAFRKKDDNGKEKVEKVTANNLAYTVFMKKFKKQLKEF